MAFAARFLWTGMLAVVPAILPAQQPHRSGAAGRLRNVEIRTRDVFSEEAAEANPIYWLANLLHGTTYDRVVQREVWFEPGQVIHYDEIAELERNLRRSRWFSSAEVKAQRLPGGDVDLLVDTKDRFSLAAGASASHVGGITRVNFRFAEGNLFGTGKEISTVYENAEDEHNAYVRYFDRQLLGSWHTLEVKVGETEEGPFGIVNLERPFKHLQDPLSYGVGYSGFDQDVDYFRAGETVAEVPQRQHSLRLFAARGWGPRELRASLGPELRLRTAAYGVAFGPEASRIRVPRDTDEIQLGPKLTVDYLPAYRKVTGLDTLDFVQDLALGISVDARPALVYRSEDGRSDQLQALLDLGIRTAMEPAPETYLTLAASGKARMYAGELQGWRGSLALHAFQMSLPAQTLAGSLTFDVAGERQDLPPQLTLGEDNGLRGYPAREFSGTRILRLNLEDRIDTGIEILSVHFGLVGFLDVGWIHGTGEGLSLSEPIRSAGFGLRIGSSHFLGDRVVRVDLAWPLDEVNGQDFSLSASFAVGQVFSFFGNSVAAGFELFGS